MKAWLLPALAGLVCGVLSGLGIGGGTLLMVWMTAICGLEQRTAQGINLLYFLPTAVCALILLAGKGHEKYQLIGGEKLPLDERETVRKILGLPHDTGRKKQ